MWFTRYIYYSYTHTTTTTWCELTVVQLSWFKAKTVTVESKLTYCELKNSILISALS